MEVQLGDTFLYRGQWWLPDLFDSGPPYQDKRTEQQERCEGRSFESKVQRCQYRRHVSTILPLSAVRLPRCLVQLGVRTPRSLEDQAQAFADFGSIAVPSTVGVGLLREGKLHVHDACRDTAVPQDAPHGVPTDASACLDEAGRFQASAAWPCLCKSLLCGAREPHRQDEQPEGAGL